MPTALITGASTGIGAGDRAAARAAGWTVLAGVREPRPASGSAGERRPGGSLPLTLDVTDPAQIASAAARVRRARRRRRRRGVSTRSSTTPASASAGRSS